MKFKAYVRTGICKSEAEFEINDSELEGLDEAAREELLYAECQDVLAGHYEIWWEEQGDA